MEEFDKEEDFHQTRILLDMQRSDLQTLFSVMDRDKGGTVDYDEFVQQMTLVKSQDSNTILFIIKHYVTECYMKLMDDPMGERPVKTQKKANQRTSAEGMEVKDS